MGPIRYLWLRRMHLAHRALLLAEPGSTSVTDVATDHGFWELGRFSVEYRQLFGETPSATLRLQFHRGFGFRAAADLVPYFARLGISHLYASPIATARPGSMHGYDAIDATTGTIHAARAPSAARSTGCLIWFILTG